MSTQQFAVLHDSKGEYWEGAIVSGAVAQSIQQRGGCIIPVDPAAMARNPVGGFFKRAWGSGWEMHAAIPKMMSPMILLCHPELTITHWRARLQATNFKVGPGGSFEAVGPVKGWENPKGFVRLASDSGFAQSASGGLSGDDDIVVDLAKLGEPDAAGGWFVGGSARLTIQAEGYYAFGLYAAGTGARVVWSAISQTP